MTIEATLQPYNPTTATPHLRVDDGEVRTRGHDQDVDGKVFARKDLGSLPACPGDGRHSLRVDADSFCSQRSLVVLEQGGGREGRCASWSRCKGWAGPEGKAQPTTGP